MDPEDREGLLYFSIRLIQQFVYPGASHQVFGSFLLFALMNKRTHVPVVIATATVIIETGLGYVGQAGLKCLYSRGYPTSDS